MGKYNLEINVVLIDGSSIDVSIRNVDIKALEFYLKVYAFNPDRDKSLTVEITKR